jgi:integrase
MPIAPGVTEKHGRYYVVRNNKWHPLTRVDQGEVALLEAYYELTKADPHNMAGVLLAFVKNGMTKLRPPTQKDYRRIVITRLIPFCGHMPRNSLKPTHVAQYLDQRETEGAAVAGNRERACLSSACNYGMRKGYLDFNPCHGVRRNRETPSKVYVSDAALTAAIDRAPLCMQDLLAVAYLTGIRQTDLRFMTPSAVHGDRLRFIESKTGKPADYEITKTLRFFIDRALNRARSLRSGVLFNSPRGLPWSEWGLQSAMRRLKPGFQFRQLRPKAQTDAPDRNVIGHMGQMRVVYTRGEKRRPVK